MARFTSVEDWAQSAGIPKRIKQALLWIVATGDPAKSTAPTLALLAMAGQHGLTKREIKNLLRVDVSGVLSRLRSEGAIEQMAAGIFRLKSNSSLLGSAKKEDDQTPFDQEENVNPLARRHTRSPLRTLKVADPSSKYDPIDPIDPIEKEVVVATVRSTRSVRSTGVARVMDRVRSKPPKKKKSYRDEPSKRPIFREWKARTPSKWDPDSCFGYWLERFRQTYGIEDPRFIGEAVKSQRQLGHGIMAFIRSERGLNGEVGHWKEYVDWLLDQFAPKADWLDKALKLGQVIRLPNGKPNFFLTEWRESKAKLPAKKKTKYKYIHRTWGYERVEVDE